MRTRLSMLATIAWFSLAGAGYAQSISITGPDRAAMAEGQSYPITWSAEGIQSVSLVAYGERTPLGTRSRGSFSLTLARGVAAGAGKASWTVPWLDTVTFTLKAKGYDAAGKLVATDTRRYDFRPAVMIHRKANGIYLDLHQPRRQRLYVQREGRLTHAFLSSSSANYNWKGHQAHPTTPHDHAGVFRVLSKSRSHWSNLYQVQMPYAMRYHGGHYIHATSSNLYSLLGRPASHGCNRMTLHDARQLYAMTPIGTRVEVIGPG